MRVILRENVPNVGKIGDVLNVSDGFGRNYLLPRNLAVLANERSEAQFEHNKRVAASRLAKAKEEAKGVAKALDGLRLRLDPALDRRRLRWCGPRRPRRPRRGPPGKGRRPPRRRCRCGRARPHRGRGRASWPPRRGPGR